MSGPAYMTMTAAFAAEEAAVSPELIRRVKALPRGKALVRERRPDGTWIEKVVDKRSALPPSPPRSAAEAPSPLPPAGDGAPSVGYRFVSPESVSHRLRVEAEDAVRTYCRRLGIAPPRLRWFRRSYRGERPDFTEPGAVWALAFPARHQIWLEADNTPRKVRESVRHELEHLLGGDEAAARRAAAETWSP